MREYSDENVKVSIYTSQEKAIFEKGKIVFQPAVLFCWNVVVADTATLTEDRLARRFLLQQPDAGGDDAGGDDAGGELLDVDMEAVRFRFPGDDRPVPASRYKQLTFCMN